MRREVRIFNCTQNCGKNFRIESSVHVIDIPFTTGFDVSGRCEIALGADAKTIDLSTLVGIRLELVSTDGASIYEGEVFQDGSILVLGVTAGEYRIRGS